MEPISLCGFWLFTVGMVGMIHCDLGLQLYHLRPPLI
jgi:hypothetical protein